MRSGLITCWRVLPLGQNVITGCQVCLDTDGILCTNIIFAVEGSSERIGYGGAQVSQRS